MVIANKEGDYAFSPDKDVHIIEAGNRIYLQFHDGWAVVLHDDGTWHTEDTSGG